jgi:hypothetical protein
MGAGLAVGSGARDRADQSEGRGAGSVRPAGRAAGHVDLSELAITLK